MPELLRLVPGLEVVDDDYEAPGYMCAMLPELVKRPPGIDTEKSGG